ncbi:MAG: 30S ribosomal protein S9 [Bacteroidales bacterium]|nr:30S ribosomal protein S9 [Bacteroidales bacterium]MDE5606154.1 30S ribosomal protein S9 [Bacteroidales bacterium]MDE5736081.1 30S ribosomal protein S9 [Bacteroidales bacterium]MDE5743664.1 30S ribosomal protein S9 [Bacteroidales bacterium]MDE6106156.1 30S ribosomal protein S9 [Bacteroidales bacterium]
MEVFNRIGRRKTAVARVYLSAGNGNITVNGKDYKEYFPTGTLQYVVNQAFEVTNTVNQFDVKANIDGGGINGQAEALRLGIARALVEVDAEHKAALKAQGLMTRDPRMVERKKPGRPKARKRFQFSKR